MLSLLTPQDLPQIYRLLEESFPREEYRSYSGHRALLDNTAYRAYGLPEGTELKALLALWDLEDLAYIEHLAVSPTLRGAGLGGTVLKEALQNLGKRVCLEVEPPETDLARRRIGFYQRHGFTLNPYPYWQPPFSPEQQGLPLLVMSTGGALSPEEFHQVRSTLYRRVYGLDRQGEAIYIRKAEK